MKSTEQEMEKLNEDQKANQIACVRIRLFALKRATLGTLWCFGELAFI